jgi:hypothetical protein
MTKPTREPKTLPTISPFNNELNQERTTIQPPALLPELPPDISVLLGGSSVLIASIWGIGYLLWDRVFKPRGDRLYAKLMHPYNNLETVRNNVQIIRSETNAQRAVLMELNSRSGLMFDVAQEMDSGISKIFFTSQDNQPSCIKKILERFHDEKFISREVDKVELDSYKGFLRSHGVNFVIYYKIGGYNDINWMLALHYRYTNHADFLNACDMRAQIGARCDELYYQLMQRSPVKVR